MTTNDTILYPSTRSSRSSSSSSSTPSSRPSLTLDLSNLPPLSLPSPPSNTLLITDLNDLRVFQPSSLATIRSKINDIASLNSFSPLPSLRRIVCSFLSTDDAIRVRQHVEMSNLLEIPKGRLRVYFGEHTPIEGTEEARRGKLLEAPQLQKLFFISPPPSPPVGWVMRNEEPPNKEVHAGDLAEALAMLRTEHDHQNNHHDPPDPANPMITGPASPVSVNFASSPMSENNNVPQTETRTPSWPLNSYSSGSAQRSRSSTLIYHPSDHGGSPNLPAVMVEDTSVNWDDEDDVDMTMEIDTSPTTEAAPKKIFARTALPPVELMEH